MKKDDFINIIENEFFDLGAVQLTESTNFKELEAYDSLTGMAIITTLEEKYNVKIPVDEYKKINTIVELYNYIENLK
jgi:acyl carrier protein